ncbi:BTAD domain-containing putative transcriptional regulator [Conexibacter sp. CPCC 206217]|uniref:BTAD domain-containing putative transcriptional regulator n=1 Tax=Conexibacter sp. CPCC 206217 TaxID=3064574 RepID=UPI002715EE4A|nr:BTAD domain-containing putative transcriptional regulator [Conexibacter sp. CPCC 206217]MDO8213209.1 BTAD domain-containing putative transcriptional regulator [Conexibacter sp. CPCC 206217]
MSVSMGDVLTEVALCGEVRARALVAPLPNGLATQLFAYLVLHRRRPVQHSALIDALWSVDRPRDPRAVLSSLLSRLRRSLGAEALPVGQLVQLLLDPDARVDVEEASGALVAARAALDRREPGYAWEQAELTREIAGRGLLVGFEARWIDPWRTDVESTHLDALELLARAGAALGGERARAGERAARQAISRAPLRESAHAALMEVLGTLDEPAAALQVYEELRRSLDAELGTVPSPAVRELHQRLLGASSGIETAAARSNGTTASVEHAPSDDRAEEAAPPRARASEIDDIRSTAARLDALGDEPARLVERVAALGDVAAVELLVRLAEREEGMERRAVLEALQHACDAGLLTPTASWLGPAVAFPHPPDAAAVIAGMPLTRPGQIAADALALLDADDGDRVAIARLALRAVPALARDEAVTRARTGVELLLRGRAFDQAATLAEQALAVGPGRRDRVGLLLDLGRALRRDDPDRAWRAAVSAYEAARDLDDPHLLARAALAAGASGPGADVAHADPGLARRLREALERVGEGNGSRAADPARAAAPAAPAPAAARSPERDRFLRAQLLARLALDRSWSDPDEAELLAAEAGSLAGDTAKLPLRVAARVTLARAGARRDPSATTPRLGLADLVAARARAEGDRAVEVAALLQRLPLLGELGRAGALEDDLDRLHELGRALGDARTLRVVADVRTVQELLAGRPLPPGPRRPGWCDVRVAIANGRAAAVLGEVDDLVRLQPALDGPRALAALVRLLAGDREAAQRRLRRWNVGAFDQVARSEGTQLHAWTALGFVAARLGDRERAAELHALLEPFAARHAVAPGTVYLAPVARALGELDAALGRPDAARAQLAAARDAADEIGATVVADALAAELDAFAASSAVAADGASDVDADANTSAHDPLAASAPAPAAPGRRALDRL